MLWTWPTRRYGNVWDEMDRLRREMDSVFAPFSRSAATAEFPTVNVWTNEDEALLTAELPGVNVKDIEVTVKNDTVTLRGSREMDELKEGETYIRRERGAGSFTRTLRLPFQLDGDKVKAEYRTGILQLTLPRAAADKPRRIAVTAA
ncbi:MAG: Hsp20/alpha crystallin family protein [Lentisphaeria bacterium]|nr:Hsp20/alpha crystallin family protein [Lentisphaeria bacterium]